MKRITFFLMMLLASTLTYAQYNAGTDSGTTGTQRTFVGVEAGMNNTGAYNTFIGQAAGIISTGSYNTFMGWRSGHANTTGNHNTFTGAQAGFFNTTGARNTFMGLQAGYKNKTGGNNTMLGWRAGFTNVNGSFNVFIGRKSGYYEKGSNKLYIDNSGTTTPLIYGDFASDELTVNGGLEVTGTNARITIANTGTANGDVSALDFTTTETSGWQNQIRFFGDFLRHAIIDDLNSNRLVIRPGYDQNPSSTAESMVNIQGDLLIGSGATPTPDVENYNLYVTEGILTEKVKVADVNGMDWADFVFEADYELNTTEEVEEFIKTNKHLPNVPSAKEVNENGVDMVEMDATLLRQIEELWLHVIDLKKENDGLKEEVKALKTNK